MSETLDTNDQPDGVAVTDVRSLRRGFSVGGAATLSLAAMRPLTGLTVGTFLIAQAGFASWLAAALVIVVMLIVAGVFGALASHWPLDGSVAAWTRQLLGERCGMLAGWLYLSAYVVYLGMLSFFDSQRLWFLLGVNAPTQVQGVAFAVLLLVLATVLNTLSRRVLTAILAVAVAVAGIGCLVFGVLLLGHAQRSFTDLFQTPSGGSLDWAWLSGAFLVGLAWASANTLRGFELPAEVAEEVREPLVNVGRVMVWSLVAGGLLSLFAMISLALAAPSAEAVKANVTASPYSVTIGKVVETTLGAGAARLLAVMLVIVTFAALAVCQLAASRTLWTMARDREVPQHRWLIGLTSRERMPLRALVVVAVVTAVLIVATPDLTSWVLGGASALPLLIAFMMALVGLIVARRRGDWHAGPWSMGRWLGVAAWVALVALGALAVNVAWPREVLFGAGVQAWRPLIILAVIVVSGLVVMQWAFRDGGLHVRNHGHVDRDLHERILLAHSATCSVCHLSVEVAEEAFWNPEAHVVICLACDADVIV